jgi:hypothetical protein
LKKEGMGHKSSTLIGNNMRATVNDLSIHEKNGGGQIIAGGMMGSQYEDDQARMM